MSKTFTIRLPDELYDQAIGYADQAGLTVADVVRTSLVEKINGPSLRAISEKIDEMSKKLTNSQPTRTLGFKAEFAGCDLLGDARHPTPAHADLPDTKHKSWQFTVMIVALAVSAAALSVIAYRLMTN